MTIKEALNGAAEKLRTSNIETPVLDAGVILCSIIKKERAFIYAHGDQSLSKDEEESFDIMLSRRINGEPIQYITGHQEFMGLDFIVGSGVLVPRPDTEILVEAVIHHAQKEYNMKSSINILDIGTGSGCIAVSLARFIPGSLVTAVDISEKALSVAIENSIRNGMGDKVKFIHGNLFDKFDKMDKFDVIVSNPPYIKAGDIRNLQREVKGHEPILALDGGLDGLYYYREISAQSPGYLNRGGFLAFEVGYDQAEAVSEIMSTSFYNIKIIKDLSGINRVVIGSINR